jgi:hypothetical protein
MPTTMKTMTEEARRIMQLSSKMLDAGAGVVAGGLTSRGSVAFGGLL